jgi:hypothetical protein
MGPLKVEAFTGEKNNLEITEAGRVFCDFLCQFVSEGQSSNTTFRFEHARELCEYAAESSDSNSVTLVTLKAALNGMRTQSATSQELKRNYVKLSQAISPALIATIVKFREVGGKHTDAHGDRGGGDRGIGPGGR